MVDKEINNKNNINNAIKASIKFDSIMDSIDFNSYLLEENDEAIGTKGHDEYKDKLILATGYCDSIINNIDGEITKIEPPHLFSDKEEHKLTQYLIWQLFEAKKIRLIGRKQDNRLEERKKYIDCSHNLKTAFISIQKEKFNDTQKRGALYYNFNWAKVLYYNELAISYSGFKKSSLSLGYAEESKTLLEELYPKFKNLENLTKDELNEVLCDLKKEIEKPSYIVSLYTFALINWGEAKRTLKEIEASLITFQRIVKIFNNCQEKKKDKLINKKSSDYFYALHHEALILIDQGRGQEAIICLKNEELLNLDPLKDYRAQRRDLEIASALIDKKEYEDAWKILNYFTGTDFDYTFIQRQAKIYQLRLMNEFRKNRPEDFQATNKLIEFSDWEKLINIRGIHYDKNKGNITMNLISTLEDNDSIVDIIKDEKDKEAIKKLWKKLHPESESRILKNIKDGYAKFEVSARDLIKSSWNRKDGDSFKGACTKLAEFYQLENVEEQIKDFEKALKCFHLYLFESKISSNGPEKINNEFIEYWLNDTDSIKSLLRKYRKSFEPPALLEKNEEENYLRNFFNVYIDHFIENKNAYKPSQNQIITIEKLKERLDYIYQQKDKDSDSEQVARNLERFMDDIKKWRKIIFKGNAEIFIQHNFFQNQQSGMHIESISDQMKRNTIDFKEKVIGRSKIPFENNNNLQCTLSVLRRWNSFTPTLGSSINKSKGGGYFLRCSIAYKSFGIVIDPGYNFLENFFSQGFKIGDIDLVLVSHAHPDHTDDLPAILSLFHEMNGRLGEYPHQKKANKINPTLIISSGVFEHYNSIINSNEEELKDIIVVDGKDKKIPVYEREMKDGYSITIHAFGTSHKDLSQFQSLGFKITVKKDDKHKTVIGYTGDIKWRPKETKPPEYLEHFVECDIICVHLGSIINIMKKKDFCNTFCDKYRKSAYDDRCYKYEKCMKSGFNNVDITKNKLIAQTRDENHLYLAGLTLFFNSLLQEKDNKLKLAIISEFGEELKGGIRIDLHKKFDSWFKENSKEKSKCLPGDIGLEVDTFTGNVYCHCCKRSASRFEIEPIPYGKEEAICFICNECKAVLSSYQIDHLLKEYCENGRKLESARLDINGGLL